LARHANQSDVTTAPTVPAAAIAAMVCWCAFDNSSIALKNSSIIWLSPPSLPWDDVTGSNLYEHLAGVNDLLLARATFAAAVNR